mmetsp:Transcript_9050/g.28454  ORF Transcript_9050/g.28454 Transcript_9050/m.28454 type:complete len:245 (+) Transcript_9050:802-1536(+)
MPNGCDGVPKTCGVLPTKRSGATHCASTMPTASPLSEKVVLPRSPTAARWYQPFARAPMGNPHERKPVRPVCSPSSPSRRQTSCSVPSAHARQRRPCVLSSVARNQQQTAHSPVPPDDDDGGPEASSLALASSAAGAPSSKTAVGVVKAKAATPGCGPSVRPAPPYSLPCSKCCDSSDRSQRISPPTRAHGSCRRKSEFPRGSESGARRLGEVIVESRRVLPFGLCACAASAMLSARAAYASTK